MAAVTKVNLVQALKSKESLQPNKAVPLNAPDLGSVESTPNELLSLVHVRTLATQSGHFRRS